MGNVALCAPSIISKSEVKVVTSDGRLVIYTRGAMKAAEIMVENPGQFVCESSCLKVGQRIRGVCAEEELERGQVYFLLPMEMLYSVLTHEELKFLSHRSTKGFMKFSKIFPEIFCLFPTAANNNTEDDFGSVDHLTSQQLQKTYSRQRSWQPALETILETPSHT